MLTGLLKMTSQPKPAGRAPQVPKSLAPKAPAGDIPLKMSGDAPVPLTVSPSGGGAIKVEGLGALPLPGAPAKAGTARAEDYIAASESNLLEVEQNFQHELRRGFAENLPQSIGYLRQRLQSFVKNESDTPTSAGWRSAAPSCSTCIGRRTR